MKTPKELKDVQNYLSKIPNINRGGCGFAAYGMYLWLKKEGRLTDDFKISYLHQESETKWGYNVNRAYVEGVGEEITSCCHAIIKLDGKDMDCRGIYSQPWAWNYRLDLGIDMVDTFMKASLQEVWAWNDSFDRMYVPKIEKALGIQFNIEIE